MYLNFNIFCYYIPKNCVTSRGATGNMTAEGTVVFWLVLKQRTLEESQRDVERDFGLNL